MLAREEYRNHDWSNLFTRMEALRCVHGIEAASKRGDTDQAELWKAALAEWIRRDKKIRGRH